MRLSTREERVSDLIKNEISRLLQREVRDPRIGFVTITGASVTPDLKSVRVFVSVLGDLETRQTALQVLNSAAGFFRRCLFRNLRLRHSPAVVFHLDDSLDRGDRIEKVLKQIHELREAAREPEDGGE